MTWIFNLLIVYFNYRFFVRIFKFGNSDPSVPRGKIKQENPWKTTLKKLFVLVKLWAIDLQIYDKWAPSQIFSKDFAKIWSILLSLYF